MTGGTNGQPIRYRVDESQKVRQEVKALGERAKQAGILDKFSAAFEYVVWRLETNPLGFGEPTHHLWNLGMVIHIGALDPVVVHFAIHEDKRFVLIQSVALLSA